MCQKKRYNGSRLSARLVSPEGAAHIRNYKYHGQDLSLTYKYFLSPLAEKCLVFVPHWMAPNFITLLGLTASFIGFLLLCIYCPDFTTHDSPSWVLPVVGAGLFIYQTLDNMDGKHARRTGSGSPLGLLFDHGCDAINCTLGTFVYCTSISTGVSFPAVALCFANQAVPFFFATWEEYHTGEMNLPIINGPSEGMLIGVALTLSNLFLPADFWWTPQESLLGATPGATIIFASISAISMTVVKQCVHVAATCSHRGTTSPLIALWDLSGFVCMAGGAALWLGSRPEGLALFAAHPYACIFLFGALNVDLLSDLMLAHIAGAHFNPLPPVLLPLALVCLNAGVLPLVPPLPEQLRVPETTALFAYLALALVYVAIRLLRIVIEVRDALGIYVFSLKKRNMD